MLPPLQIRPRTSRAIRTPRRQRRPGSLSSTTARALPIPPLHHKQTYSTRIAVGRLLAATRGIAVDRASLVRTSQRRLEHVLEVFLMPLHSATTEITAMNSGHFLLASAATRKMTGWLLLLSFYLAVSAAQGRQGASQSLSPRMHHLCLTFQHSTWVETPSRVAR